MGPKKKLKSGDCTSTSENCVKLKNNLSEIEDTLPSTSESFSNLYFQWLPNEVMLCVIKYLSPADILSLEALKDQRINELTYVAKEANFSSCRTANIDVSSFFLAQRANNLRKINFNYEIYAKPSVLVQCIRKCRHLTHLSIVDCGINYLNLCKILLKCSELRELAWDINVACKVMNPLMEPAVVCPKMMTVYLFFCFRWYVYPFRKWAAAHFPLASCIFVSSPELLPFYGARLMSAHASAVEHADGERKGHQIIIFDHSLIVSESHAHDDEVDALWPLFNGGYPQNTMYNNPPYLLFHTNSNHIASLSSCPRISFASVVMVVTSEFRKMDAESVARHVQEVAGDKLQHLSVDSVKNIRDEGRVSREIGFNNNQYDLHTLSMEGIYVCQFLNQTLCSCKNITVLNISKIHFFSESPFQAICQLKNLRTLSIPTCAFPILVTMSNHMDAGLMEVVSSCPLVDNFILTCCQENKESIKERDLVSMKFWKYLKHVSLYALFFRSCRFLRDVAKSCKYFTSLTLVGVMPHFSCIYTGDVIYVLKVATNLSFIRINEVKFNPMFEGFWNAVRDAKNLEGICIYTAYETPICTNTVIGGIQKLKHLHLFHFSAPRTSESLYKKAKQSMQLNGISNAKVQKDAWTTYQSIKSCQEFHLNDINIF